MRLPYNLLFDAYAINTDATVGPKIVAAAPGRLVIANRIDTAFGWISGPMTWLTTPTLLPTPDATFTPGSAIVNADLTGSVFLAIPTTGDLDWIAMSRQIVTVPGAGTYFRYLLRLNPWF